MFSLPHKNRYIIRISVKYTLIGIDREMSKSGFEDPVTKEGLHIVATCIAQEIPELLTTDIGLKNRSVL